MQINFFIRYLFTRRTLAHNSFLFGTLFVYIVSNSWLVVAMSGQQVHIPPAAPFATLRWLPLECKLGILMSLRLMKDINLQKSFPIFIVDA